MGPRARQRQKPLLENGWLTVPVLWKPLRAPVETHLKPYVDGRVDAQTAFHGLIAALPQ